MVAKERRKRTDDELREEEEDVNNEQKDYACFAGHRVRMQALGGGGWCKSERSAT